MAKEKTLFFCTECGAETPKWAGKCASCGAWNTITQAPKEKRSKAAGTAAVRSTGTAGPVSLKNIDAREEARISTGMEELDRVLGGGIVDGSLVLFRKQQYARITVSVPFPKAGQPASGLDLPKALRASHPVCTPDLPAGEIERSIPSNAL